MQEKEDSKRRSSLCRRPENRRRQCDESKTIHLKIDFYVIVNALNSKRRSIRNTLTALLNVGANKIK